MKMKQDKTPWLKLSERALVSYHEKQFQNPYRSTVSFARWLEHLKLLSAKDSKNILDIGCGEGANISYLARKFPNSAFTGIDLNKTLVEKGNAILKKLKFTNCKLEKGDLYDLDTKYQGNIDGIISLQTLSWLPSYQQPIEEMVKLKPDWIAMSSLFYDGFIESEIKVRDYSGLNKKHTEVFYNVYSLKLVEDLFRKKGYKKFKYIPFEIDIDIKRNKNGRMGTYTVKTAEGARLQISGPLLMNRYFIMAAK
jgi:ubiquinone/menaquinone biosynthesis C-methylase UbiE